MELFLKNKIFLAAIFVFFSLNVTLYVFVSVYHERIPFHQFNYLNNAHHFLKDARVHDGDFSLLRALGQYDAQWYLKIASEGYQKDPNASLNDDKITMGALSYAFFPFYPLILNFINTAFHNIELTAFVLANLLMAFGFFTSYYVVGRTYSKEVALRTAFLLFTFPASIFLRSYFTEGLFLLLLLWFSYFLIAKRFLYAALFLSLLNITRGSGYLLNIVFFIFLILDMRKKQVSVFTALLSLGAILSGFAGWVLFVYLQTGDPLYFVHVRSWWDTGGLLFWFYNIQKIVALPLLTPHAFHSSQIDVFMILFAGLLLYLSRRFLRVELWWISLALWIGPLLATDTMSFARYQIVSFPLFTYAAYLLNNRILFSIVLGISFVLLLLTSLFFVNWYWIG